MTKNEKPKLTKIGDTVQMKSGGPQLTIEHISQARTFVKCDPNGEEVWTYDDDKTQVTVIWYDYHWKLERAKLLLGVLQPF